METIKEISQFLNSTGTIGILVLIGFGLYKSGIVAVLKKKVEAEILLAQAANNMCAESKALREAVEDCKRTQEIVGRLKKSEDGH